MNIGLSQGRIISQLDKSRLPSVRPYPRPVVQASSLNLSPAIRFTHTNPPSNLDIVNPFDHIYRSPVRWGRTLLVVHSGSFGNIIPPLALRSVFGFFLFALQSIAFQAIDETREENPPPSASIFRRWSFCYMMPILKTDPKGR